MFVVRATAFRVLSEKISIRSFTIRQRCDLLKSGLGDRIESVRTMCEQKLLRAWLNECGGSFAVLLYKLHIQINEDLGVKVATALLTKLNTEDQRATSGESVHYGCENDVANDDKNQYAMKHQALLSTPLQQYSGTAYITPEMALLWRVQCMVWQRQGRDGLVEKCVPTAVELTEILQRYRDYERGVSAAADADSADADEPIIELNDEDIEFITLQLWRLALYVTMDEVGRETLHSFCMASFADKNTALSLFDAISVVLRISAVGSTDDSLELLVLLSDLRDEFDAMPDVVPLTERLNELTEQMEQLSRHKEQAIAEEEFDTAKKVWKSFCHSIALKLISSCNVQ